MPVIETPHPQEAANRTAKALRFVAFLDANGGEHLASTTLENLTLAQWLRIAELAGEQAPSKATISQIIGHFRGREAVAGHNPFERIGR
jgi:hypothetical protein